jgi:hypothetical protein
MAGAGRLNYPTLLPTLIVAAILYLIGLVYSLAALAAVFPASPCSHPAALDPHHNFSTKGFILGLVALPFAVTAFLRHPAWTWWQQTGQALLFLLAMPSVTAFLALNFTGSTTFTSRSGVRKEIFTYIPAMAGMFGAGLVLAILFIFIR